MLKSKKSWRSKGTDEILSWWVWEPQKSRLLQRLICYHVLYETTLGLLNVHNKCLTCGDLISELNREVLDTIAAQTKEW